MNKKLALYAAILAAGMAAPFLFPAYTTQVSYLWVMIVLATMGGILMFGALGLIFL